MVPEGSSAYNPNLRGSELRLHLHKPEGSWPASHRFLLFKPMCSGAAALRLHPHEPASPWATELRLHLHELLCSAARVSLLFIVVSLLFIVQDKQEEFRVYAKTRDVFWFCILRQKPFFFLHLKQRKKNWQGWAGFIKSYKAEMQPLRYRGSRH